MNIASNNGPPMQTLLPFSERRSPKRPERGRFWLAARAPARGESFVSVVLPVFNEVAILGALMGRLRQALAACRVRSEIIFVNDGSTDGSARVLDEIAARCSEVRVVHLSRNFGHQAAVQAGLEYARGDAVVLMDADMQDAPEAIGALLDAWWSGYDVVYALRTERKEAMWKRALFAGFHRLLGAVSNTKIPVDAGNFSLVDARVAREITALGERDRYLPGLRSWVGFRQTGVVVERLARYDDRPRVSLRGLVRLAKTAVFSFSTLPLTIFHWIGCGALAIFLSLGAYSIYCRLFTELAIPGWTSHILSASFFGALNALGISMLGEYVIRIYDQVRGRPLYLVHRTVNMAEQNSSTEVPLRVTAASDPCESLLRETADLLAMSAAAQFDSARAVPLTTLS